MVRLRTSTDIAMSSTSSVPSGQDLIAAANAAYDQSDVFEPPGLELLSTSIDEGFDYRADGFFAKVFEDIATHSVIVSFEGSILQPWDPALYTPFGKAALAAACSSQPVKLRQPCSRMPFSSSRG